MTLTIVTICLNSEATVERCITSVMRNCEGWTDRVEYLILDGDSSDRTVDIANTLRDGESYIQIISEKDEGIYDAYNKGVEMARGDYIWFVNSDDELRDKAVETVLHYIENEPSGVIQCFSVRRIDPDSGRSRIHLRTKDSKIRRFSPVCHTPGIIFPVLAVKELGLFDTSLRVCSDFKLLQAALISRQFSDHEECIIDMYLGGVSSNSKFEYVKAIEQIRIISAAPESAAKKAVPIARICIKYLRNRFLNPVLIKLRKTASAQ